MHKGSTHSVGEQGSPQQGVCSRHNRSDRRSASKSQRLQKQVAELRQIQQDLAQALTESRTEEQALEEHIGPLRSAYIASSQLNRCLRLEWQQLNKQTAILGEATAAAAVSASPRPETSAAGPPPPCGDQS